MKYTYRVISVNLVILIVYTVIVASILLVGNENGHQLGPVLALAGLLASHFIILLLTSIYYFANRNKTKGKAWLLCSVITITVGFSTCFGTMNLLG